MVLPRFQFICPFIFLLSVASKSWWLGAEVVLFNWYCFIGFNLLIWSRSFGVRVEARSTLRNYGWNCESHEVNEEQ